MNHYPSQKCHSCANPSCPYPQDSDYEAKINAAPDFVERKECFQPFPKEASAR